MKRKVCGWCKYWYSYSVIFDSATGPYDFGMCTIRNIGTFSDETCEFFVEQGGMDSDSSERLNRVRKFFGIQNSVEHKLK